MAANKKSVRRSKSRSSAKRSKPKLRTSARPRASSAAQRTGEDLFWKIVDRVRRASGGDLTASIDAFRDELAKLDDEALVGVEAELCRAMQRAYDYKLWAAAYVIHGGCSDDTFWDFRAGLIALGRTAFEAALRDPDTLAKLKSPENQTLFEGFQYVPGKLLEERGLASKGGGHGMDRKPTGTSWVNDDELRTLFPKLTSRFA